MGQATLSTLTHGAIAGVETGAHFAQRHADRVASECGPLPVAQPLQALFATGGYERGHIYGISGDASVSLLFALVAQATTQGSWLAMVNTPHVGFMAASEYGVALHRVVSVRAESQLGKVLGALADGFDLVAVSSPQCSVGEARKIAARAKAQGAVLFVLGKPGAFEIDATLSTRTTDWQFSTHAMARAVHISAHGRRVYGNRSCAVQLPNAAGCIGEVRA